MKKSSLASKVALITGSARRVGAEIARTLHDAGMNIVLHYNVSEEEAFKLCEQLNQKRKESAVVMRAELQEAESGKMLIQKAAETWKRLDVLVNNASRFYRTSIGKITDYAWDDLMNSNLKAPFFLAQSAAPFLAATQGTIINITDVNADRPLHDFAVYCISKAGLVAMTKILAKELGPLIRVNGISPGSILWPEGDNALSEEDKQKIIERTPLLRSGSPEDVAKAVLFFVRDADFITGQILNIDGGRTLG
ncbi:pteridine reductase [Aquicella lusitana]|uniref:Pteridine reductase n=1 Tax=Aquicella lusitana TaxID=254246 RepID=A0A370GFL0_9COXI|nr:pteridine reductase [Aquicella lusitana]RDI42451.1 pteridine reductase [Aquicella lusitana]VVC74087.1 3-oxoacyl-[acyl-carrier-protein] reductase FabG [Aquicella lusitana]